jgi:PPOX class probable F420-dependent enzyme
MGIADHRYVSLTTFKRNGDPVATPVWIAALEDGSVGFTTGPGSYKVKRLRNDARVELRPCDMRGKVPEGAEVVAGTAVVVTEGVPLGAAQAAIARKYGLQYRMLMLGDALKRLLRRPVEGEAAVVITLGQDAA